MAELPKVCKHVHLPMQSASDTVLARMKRGYRYAEYRALVDSLRRAMPDIAITTDFLVGFCGESEAEFEETMAALAELRFDNAFMFAYSERPGTLAARKLFDDVPAESKQRRLAASACCASRRRGAPRWSSSGARTPTDRSSWPRLPTWAWAAWWT
jgi:tRNA-2-methylthio-N6-dimethylallyladenosine synthase